MIKLGITGGIGSGKSTVSEIFTLCGVPVYNADTESKKLVETLPAIRQELTNMFGKELYEGGRLNKALLASHIFNDKTKLEAVNAIIHPQVAEDYKQWIEAHRQYKIAGHEAAILIESGFGKLVDKIVTVYTPLQIRIQRVMLRDNTTYEDVLRRISNQMPDEEKAKQSDFVIMNDGTQSLIQQVEKVISQLHNIASQ